MSTRTYALRGEQPPGWMHIAPIQPLTYKQWQVAQEAIRVTGLGHLRYVTVDALANLCRVSRSTVSTTLRKLCEMGLLRRQGFHPRGFYRKINVP